MEPIFQASWLKAPAHYGERCPSFIKTFTFKESIKKAQLYLSALGVYEAYLDGMRIGEFVLAPGWTTYGKRVQYQTYDITQYIQKENTLTVTVGNGWCVGRIGWQDKKQYGSECKALIGALVVTYEDDSEEVFLTDETWEVKPSAIEASEIYDGEVYDATYSLQAAEPVTLFAHPQTILIPQEGEWIREIETLAPVAYFTTPKGEKVIDFGQNLTGYVTFTIDTNEGESITYTHAEVLDAKGNFYRDNLRSAQQKITYTCKQGLQSYKPHFTFQGFRYICLEEWPGEVNLEDFRAIVVHSDLKRTGYFECSHPAINQLYQNIIWGQKGNFVDVPTDCPQRDERLGWTGDAQVFVRAASYNYDVQRFFKKWLRDLKADQLEDGGVPAVIPNVLGEMGANSSAWGDAAVICPWQIYLTYGDKEVLEEQFESMQKWIGYIQRQGDKEALWQTGHHYGDWLGLDAPEGSYKGMTDEGLIATAFYAYSTQILIKAGKILGKPISPYEALLEKIKIAFNEAYVLTTHPAYQTQTAYALMLYFNLIEDQQGVAKRLAELIKQQGNHLTTGFVGTPYLLHALSQNGYAKLAYDLLLREEYPSWLYAVKQGATTVWEHWDGIKPDGSMWSADMNSFNHYAYGACADWMYGVMAGITTDETKPGFEHIIFKPCIDKRLDYVRASLETKRGTIFSSWEKQEEEIIYQMRLPEGCTGTFYVNEKVYELQSGEYTYKIQQ